MAPATDVTAYYIVWRTRPEAGAREAESVEHGPVIVVHERKARARRETL